MSKLSTLKQEAYQAGKKKNWAQAIMLYEQILERDKNNPTVINELGDLCLKGDESRRAVQYFLSAAAKYRNTGLLNNAVAIYKKILRHDTENLNAHWYLAETRANQGLIVEGENHAVHFLDSSEGVTGDIKEIFLKRCQSLFDLFPQSRVILSRVAQIFRMWTMTLEASRADCLVACMDFAGGNETEARQAIDKLTGKVPDLMNYPEFAKWNALANPTEVDGEARCDFGDVALGGDAAEPVAEETEVLATEDTPAAETAVADVAGQETSENDFGELNRDADAAPEGEPASEPSTFELPAANDAPVAETAQDGDQDLMRHGKPAANELDDDGCFSIEDDSEDSSFDDLIAQASSGIDKSEPEAEILAMPDTPVAAATVDQADGTIDLLAQMLEEDGPELTKGASGELETIASEIGAVVGGGDCDDAERQYEMGMVYLEMGLFDQACESFETAAAEEAFSVRAHEMWGIALQRAERHEDAIAVLNSGLEYAKEGSREHHGLMYHLGMAKEKTGCHEEAIECFRKINDEDPSFLDVGRRLAKLTTV